MDGVHPSGGSVGLAQLIDKYGEQLAADLLEIYQVDIRDIFHPTKPLTPLYLLVLIKGLPEGSRFIAERVGGPEFRGWDASRYAAVANVNAVRALQYVYIAAHSKSKPTPPEPFPYPGMDTGGRGEFAAAVQQQVAAARKRKAARER